MIYREHPEVGAIVHVHAWIDGTPATEIAYPCGTLELADAVARLVRQAPDPSRAVVGQRRHGLTMTGHDLDDIFERIDGRIDPPGADGLTEAPAADAARSAQLLVEKSSQHLGIPPVGRGLDRLPHEEADLLLALLVVADAVGGDLVGMRGDDVGDGTGSVPPRRSPARGLASRRPGGVVVPVAQSLGQDVLGLVPGKVPSATQADELGEPVWRHRQLRGATSRTRAPRRADHQCTSGSRRGRVRPVVRRPPPRRSRRARRRRGAPGRRRR